MGEKKKEHFHERPLRWIASPLQADEENFASSGTSHTFEREASTKTLSNISLREVQNLAHRQPRLRSREESAPSELFYDLFFAAAFGSFTDSHDIDDKEALAGYIGFFCLLWITWMNVGLYDVRLARDSVFDRISKAAQFIARQPSCRLFPENVLTWVQVMAGFALVGTIYNLSPFDDSKTKSFFQTEAQSLSLILMTSRWILCVQYLSSAWYTRNHRPVWLPSIIIAASYATTACIYLAISFFLPKYNHTGYNSYIAWFVLAVIEIVINVAASCYWSFMNFKKTHLVERMSLLTLIILGEGVIVLFDSVTTAFQAGSSLSLLAPQTLAAVLFLYFIYMLYFDNLPEEHFGTIVEPIWASLHFPFHLAIVVAAVGSRFLFSMTLATQSLNAPSYPWQSELLLNLTYYPGHDCYPNITEMFDTYDVPVEGYTIYDDYFEYNGSTFENGYGDYSYDIPHELPHEHCANKTLHDMTIWLHDWFQAANSSVYNLISDANATNVDSTDIQNLKTWIAQVQSSNISMLHLRNATIAASKILGSAIEVTFNTYDLDPPEPDVSKKNTSTPSVLSNMSDPEKYTQNVMDLFNFVYCYFFIACGCLLILLGGMILLSRGKRKSRYGRRSAADENDEQTDATKVTWSFWDYMRWSGFFSAGLILTLLAIRVRVFEANEDPDDGLDEMGPQLVLVLPTATLILLAVLLVQHLPFEWVLQKTGLHRMERSIRRLFHF